MDEPRLAPPVGLEYAGISALPERGSAGIGSLLADPLADATTTLEARRRQQIGDAPDNLVDAYSAYMDMMRRIFGPSIIERTIGARDALRRGDAQAAHDLTMPAAMDFASFVGSMKPIRAYHGSPHDFDKFSMEKIGTGEGAQAYGHGLYFAENEGVARGYRMINAPPGMGAHQARLAQAALDRFSDLSPREARIAAMKLLEKEAQKVNALPPQYYYDAINNFDALTGGRGAPGRMYEVNIHADPERFLEWDAPLSVQSEKTRSALADMKPEWTGSQIYESSRLVPGDFMDKAAAASALQDRGIPGIKYLDAGSRAVGKGSRNYVVFDDNLIEILRKYGIGGILAGGAGAAGIGSLDESGL